jgi:hypothetical protein
MLSVVCHIFSECWTLLTFMFKILECPKVAPRWCGVIYVVAQTEYFTFCGCGIYTVCYDHVVCVGLGRGLRGMPVFGWGEMFWLECQKWGYMFLYMSFNCNAVSVKLNTWNHLRVFNFVLFLKMQDFDGLVHWAVYVSSVQYMLCKFWIVPISSYGLNVFLIAGFKWASSLSYIS